MPALVSGDVVKEAYPKWVEDGTTLVPEVWDSLKEYDGATEIVEVQIEYQKAPGSITPACARCIGVVFGVFGRLPIGTIAVRFIAETHIWSQHAYGNAVDFITGTNETLRYQISHFVNANRGGLDVAHLLADPWFPSPLGNHYNHVHVDFYPQWGGTPPGHPI